MQCEEVHGHFADYLVDRLTEPLHSSIERHLASCERCATEAQELKLTWAQVASIPAEKPTPAMRTRFDTMLDAYKQGLTQTQTSTWWHETNSWISRWWPASPALQLGLSLALLVLGIAIGLRYQPNEKSNNEITQLRGELREMRQLVVLSLMQQQSASDRLRGVSGTADIQQPNNEVLAALLDTLKHDASVNVRLAAVDALQPFGENRSVRQGVLQALTEQESPLVKIALIDLMVELREKESVDILRRMSVDQRLPEAVRSRAEWGLERLG